MSSHSLNGINVWTNRQISNSTDMPSIKRTLSQILHRYNSRPENSLKDTEMHEFISSDASDIFLQFPNEPVKIFDNKQKFRCRLPSNEQNIGYVLISTPDSDPELISDQQATRKGQQDAQASGISSVHDEKIQYSTMKPLEQNSSPAKLPFNHWTIDPYFNYRFGPKQTRLNAECEMPLDDYFNENAAESLYDMKSILANHLFSHTHTEMDQLLLDDDDYVEAQDMDLHHLYALEIDLTAYLTGIEWEINQTEELCSSKFDIENEAQYQSAVELNSKLQEELRILKENNSKDSSENCKVSTFSNEQSTETNRYTCDIYEGPSPMKQAALFK